MTPRAPLAPVKTIDVAKLHLDPENPRLPEHLTGNKMESKLLAYLREHGVLDELAQSFIDNGYFPAEPLIVLPKRDGDYVVLEGNRRLATLAILHKLPVAEGLDFGDIQPDPDDIKDLRSVPCYVVPNRKDVIPFIGFRHIGGLKMWEPEAKARYVLRRVDEAAHARATNPFLEVARKVGSNSQGIRGSYISIATLRYARDELGLQVDRLLNESRFGVWQRALNSPNIREFIGFGDPTSYQEVQDALRGLKKDKLAEVFRDFVPSQGREKPVVNDSRLVTEYGKVLANKRARTILRKTADLELARQITDEQDLPTRVRKLKGRASVLREEIARTNPTDELREAIEELFVEIRQMRAFVNQ